MGCSGNDGVARRARRGFRRHRRHEARHALGGSLFPERLNCFCRNIFLLQGVVVVYLGAPWREVMKPSDGIYRACVVCPVVC